jgi:phosphatidylserine/phosphatidylglycerophosphate/cardiolipin synthase-like enzyme
MPELILPDPDVDTRAATVVKIFPAKRFTFTAEDPVKVQPILTPDNYGTQVLKLIRSATETLYFQNQYIKIYQTFPDTAGKPGLKELVDALIDRIAAGVDVKIILRNNDARPMLQALHTYGLDVSVVKLLAGCHNKGIIVDSKAVLVSSQNYSADGVRFNRDAGLIIYHPKVAAYFEKVFLYDWEHRAYQQIPGERGAMPLLREVAEAAPDSTRSPRGTREVVAWDDYYQD